MVRKVIPGGWYGEAGIGGTYAVAIKDAKRVETHAGPVDTSPRDLLWLRRTDVGGVAKFAGQEADRPGHQGDGNYEYPLNARVGDSFGVNPVIYLPNGVLKQVIPGESHQGYRFVDDSGRVVTGDETLPLEWTALGGVKIRQGQDSGCVVEVDGISRVLDPGEAFAIRMTHSGEDYAIAFYQRFPVQTVLVWASKSELERLVEEVVLTPVPVPPPPPPPPIGVPTVSKIDHSDVMRTLKAPLNDSVEHIFAFTKSVVTRFAGEGCGFLQKVGENVIVVGEDSLSISRVCYPDGQIYKVLSDAGPGGQNGPQWVDDGVVDAGRYRASVREDNPAPVPGPPPGPPPGIPIEMILELNQRIDDLSDEVDKLTKTLAEVVSKTAPKEVTITGRTDPSGTSFLKHSHSFSTKVVV